MFISLIERINKRRINRFQINHVRRMIKENDIGSVQLNFLMNLPDTIERADQVRACSEACVDEAGLPEYRKCVDRVYDGLNPAANLAVFMRHHGISITDLK